jgi:hypothetical protein
VPTVGIAATGFCYLGGILQLFHRRYQQKISTSTRSTNFTAADNRSSQIDSTEFIINISYHQHQLSSTSSRSSLHCHQESYNRPSRWIAGRVEKINLQVSTGSAWRVPRSDLNQVEGKIPDWQQSIGKAIAITIHEEINTKVLSSAREGQNRDKQFQYEYFSDPTISEHYS